jgi:hypothetical protein
LRVRMMVERIGEQSLTGRTHRDRSTRKPERNRAEPLMPQLSLPWR